MAVFVVDVMLRRNRYDGVELFDEDRGGRFWYSGGWSIPGIAAAADRRHRDRAVPVDRGLGRADRREATGYIDLSVPVGMLVAVRVYTGAAAHAARKGGAARGRSDDPPHATRHAQPTRYFEPGSPAADRERATMPDLEPSGRARGALGVVAIVGDGRVGRSMAAALRAAGVDVSGPLGSRRDGGRCRHRAAGGSGCRDRAQPRQLIAPGPLVGHFSGATTLEPLASHEAFSIHPLLTVAGGPRLSTGVPAAVAGSTPRALDTAAGARAEPSA